MTAMTSNGYLQTAQSGCCSALERHHDRVLNFTLTHGQAQLLLALMPDSEHSSSSSKALPLVQRLRNGGRCMYVCGGGGHATATVGGVRVKVLSRSLSPWACGQVPHPSFRQLPNLKLGFCPLFYISSPFVSIQIA